MVRYEQSSATLGPWLNIDGTRAILTVAHLFPVRPFQTGLLAVTDNASSLEGFTGDEERLKSLDDDEYDEEYDEERLKSLDALWSDDDEYDEEYDEPGNSDTAQSAQGTTRQLSTGQEAQTPDVRSSWAWEVHEQPTTGVGQLPDVYLDWALVRPVTDVENPTYLEPENAVHLAQHDPIFLSRVRYEPPTHLAPIYLLSGARGVLRGWIRGDWSSIPSLTAAGYCRAWTVILEDKNREWLPLHRRSHPSLS
jgi:hypothetical protein